MLYRSFPKIPGLRVSALGFGCMRLPTLGGDPARIDEPKATALLHRAIALGVNYVDTAWPYHGGQSEPFLGRALARGLRDRVQLATKLPVWMVNSEADWERFLDEQLKKLATDHIDFYLLHALNDERWKTVVDLRGLEAMERAKADGRIRHLGFSFHGPLDAFKTVLAGYDGWEFCQLQTNFVDTEYQAGLAGLELAAQRGLGVVAMEPLRGGSLAKNVPDEALQIWARSGLTRPPAEWALRWVLDRAEVVCALSGMNAEEQLAENLAVAGEAGAGALRPEERALAAEVRAVYRRSIQVPCTTCGYCLPCKSEVAIPDVFWIFNASAMFKTGEAARAWYQNFLVKNGSGADQCTLCRECEEKCPQHIAIPDELARAHKALSG